MKKPLKRYYIYEDVPWVPAPRQCIGTESYASREDLVASQLVSLILSRNQAARYPTMIYEAKAIEYLLPETSEIATETNEKEDTNG